MPRAVGQIDLAKTEAILDAAAEVFGERGTAASMEEIARRACVSKQTIYNHFGSKPELIRALVDRRVEEMALGEGDRIRVGDTTLVVETLEDA